MVTVTSPARYSSRIDSRYTRSDLGTFDYAVHMTSANLPINDTRTTNSNPDWKARVARRSDASSAYNLVRTVTVPPLTYCTCFGYPETGNKRITFTSSCFQQHVDPSFIDGLFTGDDMALRDQALARLKQRYSSNIGSMNAMVPIAELRQLRGLVSSVAASATGIVQALINIKRTKGRSAARFAADAWLTWSLGIKPTISDVNAAAQAVADYLARTDRMVNFSGTAKRTWLSAWNPGGTTGAFGADYKRLYTYEHTLSYRYKAGFSLLLRSGNDYGLDDHFGLSFGQLPATLWELVPYSWVIDYFGTVGAFFEDVFETPYGTSIYCVMNRRYECFVNMEGCYKPWAMTATMSQSCRPGFAKHFQFSRTPLSALPRRALRFKTMDEIGRNGVNRLLNLSALLIK